MPSTVFTMSGAMIAGLLFAAVPVSAELGGPLASVKTDGAAMRAKIASVGMGRYTRHNLTRDNGGSVHEFTNAGGQVFAVTWAGPGKPDLQALLGDYFSTFQAQNTTARRNTHALRRPLRIDRSDLQIQTSGHMGWFRGVAYIPSLAPDGFTPADLEQDS